MTFGLSKSFVEQMIDLSVVTGKPITAEMQQMMKDHLNGMDYYYKEAKRQNERTDETLLSCHRYPDDSGESFLTVSVLQGEKEQVEAYVKREFEPVRINSPYDCTGRYFTSWQKLENVDDLSNIWVHIEGGGLDI